MTTISASTTLGLFLNPASYTNPIVIDAGVTITNSGGDVAVTVTGSPTFFTVENEGVISASASSAAVGVFLSPGGSVTNAASASIYGGGYGVEIRGSAGTVVNDGSIATASTAGLGVFFDDGGSVTNAASASITGGAGGVVIERGAGTVVNDGSIAATGTDGSGVQVISGASVINAANASITGYVTGVDTTQDGTLVNSGSIAATGSNGIGASLGGGTVTNAASGSITGADGVEILGAAGTVVNYGSIAATAADGYGVGLDTGGSVTNAASGSITGGSFGVYLSGDATLTNAGTIIGGSGTAVAFGGVGNGVLVLQPGFGFSGVVAGATGEGDTLELASAASAGTVSGLGTAFTYFGPIMFDAGARWSIAGDTAGLAGTISGFAAGDTIEVTGVTATTSSFSDGILTLHESVGSATLDLPGSFTSAANFDVHPNGGGTEVTVACFAAGVRILTAAGEVPVEALTPGDLVVTRSGRLRPVRWVGHRRIDLARHPRPRDVCPVRVQAQAFGPGMPHRDLVLSPDHGVFVDDVLVPVRYLLNGATVVQEAVADITYFHVELPTHDVLIANGLGCESYLDTGNRAAFANGGTAVVAHADDPPEAGWHGTDCDALLCAPGARRVEVTLLPPLRYWQPGQAEISQTLRR